MKILLLADPSSTHTIKWANGLIKNNFDIAVYGLTSFNIDLYDKRVSVHSLFLDNKIINKTDGNLYKVTYLKALRNIKKFLDLYKPDILHAHYASSYGLLGALTNYHPYILSVWGADVYRFPGKSILHKSILRFNLNRADKILSTSNTMATDVEKYTNQEVEVTPFGVDLTKFKPKVVNRIFGNDALIIGTIKTLEPQYGVEYLIEAFANVKKKYPSVNLKLLIVGKGSLFEQLKELTLKLGIERDTHFTGYVSYDSVEQYHNMLDINVSASVEPSESFGVAVLEASACGKPVIVTRVGGLVEVVTDKITGTIVEPKDADQIADAISYLIDHPDERKKMGKEGREFVEKNYSWQTSLDKMVSVYSSILVQ